MDSKKKSGKKYYKKKKYIDETAKKQETIIFSAGKIGYQIEITLSELEKVIKFELNDICN